MTALLQLRSRVAEAKAEAFVGVRGLATHFSLVIPRATTAPVHVFKPNGDLLLAVYPKAVSEDARERARPFLDRASKAVSHNRGTFLGGTSDYLKADGTRSNTTQTPAIRTSIHGHFDRTPRFPFCRETAMVSKEKDAWREVNPMLREVAACFEKGVPKRYAAQLAAARETHPAYVIEGTPFTTLTVNGTLAGAYHRDAGDYAPGFGCMVVLRERAEYRGCLLGFPAFGVAADLDDRSVILFDPHEIHGNTAFEAEGEPHKDFRRTSIVAYFRAKMPLCGSPAEELERVKNERGTLPGADE